MAKIKFKNKEAFFSNLNVRAENEGDKHVPASDISLNFSVTKSDINNLVLCDDGKATDWLYTTEGQLRMPVISPLPIHRNPDSISVVIYDKGKKSPLKFLDAKAKDFELDLGPKYSGKLSFKLQVRPNDGQLDRLAKLLKESCTLDIEAMQEDLPFAQEEEEGDEGGDEAQQELPDAQEEDEEEEEQE